jgi:uncharacterized membrane protein
MVIKMRDKTEKNKKFADGLCFEKIVWIFLICCILGFIVETIWCFIRHGYIESRKSLVYGPFSVAYGMGGVILTLVLYKLKDSSLWKIFMVSFVAGTVTEYICSLGQEIIFGSVAWDYSDVPLNINGRVCLLYSLFWGVLGIVWIKLIYPLMSKMIEKAPISAGELLTWAFILFFVVDCFLSATAAIRMDKRDDGIVASNKYEVFLDSHFDDERMHKIYANSNDVE